MGGEVSEVCRRCAVALDSAAPTNLTNLLMSDDVVIRSRPDRDSTMHLTLLPQATLAI